jgi:hypothetical protein
MVNSNTHSTSVLLWDASSFELLERKSSASTDTAVVSNSRASHNGSKKVQRSWGHKSSLLSTGETSRSFLAGLIKMNSHTLLPVLAEVVLYDGIIFSDCWGEYNGFFFARGSSQKLVSEEETSLSQLTFFF